MYPSMSATQTGARKQQSRDESGPSNHGHDLSKTSFSKTPVSYK